MRCTYCGNEFRAVRRDTLFCSRACRQAAYRARHRPLMEDIKESIRQARVRAAATKRSQQRDYMCLECGRYYQVNANQVGSQFCSGACRQRMFKRRRKLFQELERSLKNVR